MFKILTIFFLLAFQSSAYALSAPTIAVSSAGAGKIQIDIQQDGTSEGYNVFFNAQYLSTHRLQAGSNRIKFSGEAGEYCVSRFGQVNGSMQYSPCSAVVRLDSTNAKPSMPGDFRFSVYSGTSAELFWNASTDDGIVKSYEIKRDSQVVATIDARSYFEPALQVNRQYNYSIVAIDNSGSRSAAASLVLSTGSNPGAQPPSSGDSSPSVPKELSGQFYSRSAAEIFWKAASSNVGIASYEIRRDGQLLDVRDGRSFYDSNANRDSGHFYEVVAIDFNGNRSNAAQLALGNSQNGAGSIKPKQPIESEGQLKIDIPSERYTLQEGAVESLFIPFSIRREPGNNREVNLSLRAEHVSSNDKLLHQILPAKLSQNESGAVLEVRLGIAVAPIEYHERRFFVVANDANHVIEKLIVFDIKPINAPDVYLLAGQSNMEGSSEFLAKNTRVGGFDELNGRIKQLNVQPNSRVAFREDWQFTDEYSNTSSPRYITAEDPLHEPRSPVRSIKEASFVGMGLSFAKAAIEHTTQEIYLVPAAWSATGFCAGDYDGIAWNAKPTPERFLGGTLLADRALTRLNMTLRETGGIFRGILWHQGEADSNSSECANRYKENLQKLVVRFRTDAMTDRRGAGGRGPNANIPFIVGTMSKGNDSRGAFEYFGATKSVVDAVHRDIENSIPHAAFSNNDDLRPPAYPCGQGSCIHFGASAYRMMGYRYYEALRRIIER